MVARPTALWLTVGVSNVTEDANRRMLRARDEMDRRFADPLDVAGIAAVACVAPSTFIRSFKATFGETPHQYLRHRRIERAMYLLGTTELSVTDVCMRVGFSSLGSFSSTFRRLVGETPAAFRARTGVERVPSHFVGRWTRPGDFGEAA